MQQLRILAVDDEPLALRRMRRILDEIPDTEFVAEALGCDDAIKQIEKERPDVILLDIAMRDGTGFDLIERLSPVDMPAVIFVTAFDHHAARAFEVSAIDFVLKPVQPPRLSAAIDRARERMASLGAAQQLAEMRSIIDGLREGLRERSAQRFETELWIRKSNGAFSRISVDSIRWIESEEDYVRVHTAQASYLMRGSIKRLEQRFDAARFARIHRRTLVNIDEIAELSSATLGELHVRLRDGHNLRVGRIYARNIKDLINQRAPVSSAAR